MKIIHDIRLFKSRAANENGQPMTISFGDKQLNAVIHRIVMKLREQGFSLGDFDHLYINFTCCGVDGGMKVSDRVDRYHPWYRYCDVQISAALHDRLGSKDAHEDTIALVSQVLENCFASADFDAARIRSCITQALEQRENMRMKFKEKTTSTRRAVIFLRYLDTCKYLPLLQVTDPEGRLLFETDLPETLMLDYLGEIRLSSKKVAIHPRKNAFTANLQPLVFEYR